MEGLILALVIMAIGAFFNNKKPDGAPESPDKRRRAPATTGQRTLRRVEDYAREKYGELQTQMKEHPEQAKKVMDKVDQAKSRLPQREIQQAMKPLASTGRLSAHKAPEEVRDMRKKEEVSDIFPLEAEDLQKAIIYSEILLPPKSKR
jgi:predicted nuclease with TOPRIM domain